MTYRSHDPEVEQPRAEIDQLTEATLAARRAPSILNTQPWHWQFAGPAAELTLDSGRHLSGLDPDGRMLTLSCGIALHHAITALRAGGYAGAVTRFPDARRRAVLARVRRGPECAPDRQNYDAIYTRRTDRRPFTDAAPPGADLDALRAAAARHGVHLRILTAEGTHAFALLATEAGYLEYADAVSAADLQDWTDRPRGSGDGVTAPSLPAATRRAVPARNFPAPGGPRLAVGPGSDRGTVVGVLITDDDRAADWLAAGEALSDVWLTLTTRRLAASPISEVVETPATRTALRELLGGDGYPAIALRIGVPAEGSEKPPATARRADSDVIGLPGTH